MAPSTLRFDVNSLVKCVTPTLLPPQHQASQCFHHTSYGPHSLPTCSFLWQQVSLETNRTLPLSWIKTYKKWWQIRWLHDYTFGNLSSSPVTFLNRSQLWLSAIAPHWFTIKRLPFEDHNVVRISTMMLTESVVFLGTCEFIMFTMVATWAWPINDQGLKYN